MKRERKRKTHLHTKKNTVAAVVRSTEMEHAQLQGKKESACGCREKEGL